MKITIEDEFQKVEYDTKQDSGTIWDLANALHSAVSALGHSPKNVNRIINSELSGFEYYDDSKDQEETISYEEE